MVLFLKVISRNPSKTISFSTFIFYLKGTVTERKDTEKMREPSAGSLSKCLYYPGLGQSKYRSQEHFLGLPMCKAGTQLVRPPSIAFPDSLATIWIRNKIPRMQTHALIWDTGIIKTAVWPIVATIAHPLGLYSLFPLGLYGTNAPIANIALKVGGAW